MSRTATRTLLVGGLVAGLGPALEAQSVRGTVVSAEGAIPVPGATVQLTGGGAAVSTDRFGRFTVTPVLLADTIVVRAVGWQPATIPLDASVDRTITVRLERATLVIADLLAVAEPSRRLDLAEHGQWIVPTAYARTIPPAVETDVFRALALVPAVSFSSPLSARPSLRGYDAQDVTTRIDGFEILNLYHLGKIFSSFPADAADQVVVSTAPYSASQSGSAAGIVDITGRTGQVDRLHAGAGWSYGSLSAHAGGRHRGVRYFANARLFYWKALDLVPDIEVPYHFEDLYAGVVFGAPELPRGRLTIFATRDRAGHVNQQSYLHWNNLMMGGRWRILDQGAASLEASASVAHFNQRGEDVPGLNSVANADIRNRFARSSAGLDLTVASAATRLGVGLALGWRSIGNRIVESAYLPEDGGQTRLEFPIADLATARPEIGSYLTLSRQLGHAAVEAGMRIDAAGGEHVLQPRLHGRLALGPRAELSAAVGRTSRLYHVLSEARSEPEFDFLDFWLGASDSIPAAAVDHASLDLRVNLSSIVARLSVYGSTGTGMGELQPSHDQRPKPQPRYRFGRSRTAGLEAQLALRRGKGALQSATLSYSWTRSERDWDGRWVRWALDRRHQVRGFGQLRSGGWAWSGTVDLASGLPITPIAATLPVTEIPGIPPGATALGRPAAPPLYGVENSAGTSGTFRFDIGMQYNFGGPQRQRFTIGVAVINLFGTAVAPFGDTFGHAAGRQAVDPSGLPLPYRRLFDLPPIPTITLRVDL